ncbi:MAG: hypothetical protein RLZZ293_889, partial [Pseudomonadota bacterium]
LQEDMVDDLLFYAAIGVILGGRLGYCLFYQPSYYLTHPIDMVKTWDGGMSFHGGMLGVFVALYCYARKINSNFFVLSDFVAPFVPIGLMFGRIGNFINGELYGRFCDPSLPWGMVFPQSGSNLPRHPSQIYEALSEGLILFLVLFIFTRKTRNLGQISGVFMLGYGITRFILEFFREPDAFATGIVKLTGLSLGQFYSLPMIIAGLIILFWGFRSKSPTQH